MKRCKRIFTMLLVIVMSLSLMYIPAAAESNTVNLNEIYNTGVGYLAIGDSWTRGYGASDSWDDEGYNMDAPDGETVWTEKGITVGSRYCRNVTGSYPWLVANALGLQSNNDILDKDGMYWPLAQDAVTTSNVLDLIGVGDDVDNYGNLYGYAVGASRYNTILKYFGCPESLTTDGVTKYGKSGEVYTFKQLVQNASLISIAVGMGDTFNTARAGCVSGLDLSKTEDVITALERFVSLMDEGYKLWEKNYRVILDYFKENATGTVVIVGCFNPAVNMSISDEYPVPVGTVLSTYTTMMNKQYKEWAKEYGYIFVDVSNVDTGAVENDISIIDLLSATNVRYQGLATHPTPTGYQQIANAIIDALEQNELENQANKTRIRVDLGRIKSVSYVTLDGKTIKDYTLEDGVLTINRGVSTYSTLSVGCINESGKLAVAVYSLSFDSATGYSCYRVYTTNNVAGVVKSISLTAKSLLKGLFSK